MRCFSYNSISESAVDCDIAVIPGIVDFGIDIGGVGGVPHVMLEEPEQWIAEEIVVLVVDISWRGNKVEIKPLTWQCHLETTALTGSGHAIAFSHSAGDPGELYVLAH